MPRRAVCLALGFACAHATCASEPQASGERLSPVRQYLRDSLKAKLPPPSVDAYPNVITKPSGAPLVLPPFIVSESKAPHVIKKVTTAVGQEKYLSTPALIKTKRLDVLHRPKLDDQPSPSGMPRLKLDIFQLKW